MVNNTGPALTKEQIEILEGSGANTVREDKGLGIVSLAISRAGGSVEVKTDQTSNAVTVELPAHWTEPLPMEFDTDDSSTADVGQPRLLLAEDNRELREYLTSFLQSEYVVTAVASLKAARNAIDTKNFDLVLSDILMPDGSGLDFVREMKTNPETSHLPAIVMTALSDEETHREALQAWADDFLTKPFEPYLLLLKIRTRLRAINLVRERLLNGSIGSLSSDADAVAAIAPADEKLIKRLDSFFHENFSRPGVKIEDAAKACAVSKRTLQRKLSEMFAKSFSELILERRLTHATHFLNNGYSIQEAATQSGFSQPGYFSRRFKEAKGITPTEYRAQQVQED